MTNITVKEVIDTVFVQDAETRQPVQISNQTLQVTDSDTNISVLSNDGDRLVVQDGGETVTVQEKKLTITPAFKEVLTIIQQVPKEDYMPYTEEVDFVGADTVYRGWANPGTTTDLSLWRIRRTRFIGEDGDVIHDWADSNANFDNVWDDRATKTYG